MEKSRFEQAVIVGEVDSVALYRAWTKESPTSRAAVAPWELWAYGGEAINGLGNRVKEAGYSVQFPTLDAAYEYVRGAGYCGAVAIDEGFRPADPEVATTNRELAGEGAVAALTLLARALRADGKDYGANEVARMAKSARQWGQAL